MEKISEVNDFSQNLHTYLHTLMRSLKKTGEQKQLAMEESLDINMTKTEWKYKAQKGLHVLQI